MQDQQNKADKIENRAALRAYQAGLGASEWEAFLTQQETIQLIELGDKGFGTWGKEPQTLARIKSITR